MSLHLKLFAIVAHSSFDRLVFLPIILVNLPVSYQIDAVFTSETVIALQWFAFCTFSALLVVPWLLCIHQLVTNRLESSLAAEVPIDEHTAPKLVVVMPCYKEDPETLLRTVNSIVECNYPKACIHIFLSFDGAQEDGLYLETIESLGVPLVRSSGFPASIDVVFKYTRITVSRFPHGGKRHCQKLTFELVNKVYTDYLSVNQDVFVLFIDSDCIMDPRCIQNL